MRHKLRLLILIAGIVFSLCCYKNSSADSTLVEGNSDSLIVITETRFLDDKPVLFFSEQLEGKKPDLLNKIDNIVFYDNTWQDLAVEFTTHATVRSPQSTVKIEKAGVYELWIDYSKLYTEKKRVTEWEIKVDGKPWVLNTKFWLSDNKERKYIKLGEGDLKTGRHIIKSKIQNPKSQNQEIKLILVNKQERQRAEKIIWQKMNEQGIDIAYIFSQDGKFYSLKGKSYTLKLRLASAFIESKKNIDKILANKPLLKIDGRQFFLNDFSSKKSVFDSQGFWLELENLNLAIGEHKIELLNSDNFNVNLIIIEPVTNNQKQLAIQEPKITFKKINPTKYLVEVEDAREPFWLVFSESFHRQWKLYLLSTTSYSPSMFDEIVADYPDLGVSEAKHLVKFTFSDIKYLFRKSITDNHYLVNGYANGWYIEPKELGLDKDFTLVLYFWPQSLFYLGLGISGFTLLGCVGYLAVDFLKIRRKRRFKEGL
ncbi:MAG: hypothetical protein Q8N49_01155 [Candidatus Omnitrophota bacterium]|nr:hypothetical protein [Candidatus Omnitrophota bacterium]